MNKKTHLKTDRNIQDSQNFIHSKVLVEKLIQLSNLNANDTVYEIGPGKGIITNSLKNVVNKVIAIELDKNLSDKLKKEFDTSDNVSIINEDFLKISLPDEEYKVFSNIPFNITSEILSKLLLSEKRPKDLYLIMQYEAALKYSGQPYCKNSYRSLLFRPLYSTEILHYFKNTDFIPVPNASIVFVHFHLKEYRDIKNTPITEYWDFLSYIFSASGKDFKSKTKNIFSYEQQKRLRKSFKIADDSLVSELKYEQWLGMFDVYSKFVDTKKKDIVKGSYLKLLTEQSKLDKIHRNRSI